MTYSCLAHLPVFFRSKLKYICGRPSTHPKDFNRGVQPHVVGSAKRFISLATQDVGFLPVSGRVSSCIPRTHHRVQKPRSPSKRWAQFQPSSLQANPSSLLLEEVPPHGQCIPMDLSSDLQLAVGNMAFTPMLLIRLYGWVVSAKNF